MKKEERKKILLVYKLMSELRQQLQETQEKLRATALSELDEAMQEEAKVHLAVGHRRT